MVSYLIGYLICYVLILLITLIDEEEIILRDLLLGLLGSLTSWFGVILLGFSLIVYIFLWLSGKKIININKIIFKLKRKG